MEEIKSLDLINIDLRKLDCPEPVLRTKKIFDAPNVHRVEALVDDEINVQNLQRLARSLKLSFSWQKREGGFLVYLSRANEAPQGQAVASSPAHDHVNTKTGLPSHQAIDTSTVIFITKDTFGEGDREFSEHLLNIFLQSVLQAGHKPKAILMANSGVKLMAEKSAFLQVLNDFKASGTEVLACGLCLEFYGLQNAVAKEQVTNMFAICEYLFAAQRVLTP